MAGNQAVDAAQREALLVETRKRAGRIDKYVDMIPARFYLSSEVLQSVPHNHRSGLDPAQYKPTSQLIAEALKAQVAIENAEASAASSSQAGSKNKKKKKKQGGDGKGHSLEEPRNRTELRGLLEKKIEELKAERRKKQSDADREKHKAQETQAKASTEKRPREEAAAPSAKRQHANGAAAPAVADDLEVGRPTFEPRLGELPFEAGVNRKGSKVQALRKTLRAEETKVRKLEEAEETGDREALRTKYALETAMRRARGEKVHDDVSRLRKVQKQLETRKSKGKEKWTTRVDEVTKMSADKQNRRKENLKMRRTGSKKGKHAADRKERDGFEGKKGFVNEG